MGNYCLVIVASALLLCGCGKKISENERLQNAVNDFNSGNLKNCSVQVAALLEKNPDNCPARLLQALLYEKNGDMDKAVDMASAAAREYPDSFAALYTSGRLLSAFPLQRRRAYETLENAHKLNPDDVSTLILLCNLGTELKYRNVLKYLKYLQNKKEFAKDNKLNYQIGKCMLLHKRSKEALAAFKKAVNGTSDIELIFNTARMIDSANLDPRYARQLYMICLRFPGSNSRPEITAYAQSRLNRSGR